MQDRGRYVATKEGALGQAAPTAMTSVGSLRVKERKTQSSYWKVAMQTVAIENRENT
jgi:hypothetical protein